MVSISTALGRRRGGNDLNESLRYDDYNFFNESLSDQDGTVCGSKDFGGNQSVYEEAPKNDRFFAGFVRRSIVTVYGLAQCWEFVNGSACERCLAEAVKNISSCTPKEEGRVVNTGCFIRYSTQNFYDNITNPFNRNEVSFHVLFLLKE
ncbi:hypothetical protein K1719_042274 [Acacia pycnantha]|nr:hypothetical protein K1719_042274 [Acacia pycnantha]